MKNNGDDQSSQFIYFGESEKKIDNLKFNIIFFLKFYGVFDPIDFDQSESTVMMMMMNLSMTNW